MQFDGTPDISWFVSLAIACLDSLVVRSADLGDR